MSNRGSDTFLPAVPMGMSGLAEVMAGLAESPGTAPLSPPDRGPEIPLPVWRLLSGGVDR
jgi:hypothetical protein